MANPNRRDKLFSSGDFPRTLSSILSGEGFDEGEQGKSPLAILDFTGCGKVASRAGKPYLRGESPETLQAVTARLKVVP
jgi:hypothetical protein